MPCYRLLMSLVVALAAFALVACPADDGPAYTYGTGCSDGRAEGDSLYDYWSGTSGGDWLHELCNDPASYCAVPNDDGSAYIDGYLTCCESRVLELCG